MMPNKGQDRINLGGLFQVHSSPPHFHLSVARPRPPIVGLGQVAFADPPRRNCLVSFPHKPAADALPPLCCASVEQLPLSAWLAGQPWFYV